MGKFYSGIKYILISLLLVALTIALNAQNYASSSETTVSWSNAASWSISPYANFLNGNIDQMNTDITIDGTVTAGSPGSPMNLNFSQSSTLRINSGDTLIVWGDVTFSGGTSNIHLDGFFIVHGSFTITNGTTANIAGNSGFFSVEGNFSNNGSSVYNSNSSNVYILGTSSAPMTCATPSGYGGVSQDPCYYGNIDALLNNEDASRKKLVLGEVPLTLTLNQTVQIQCNDEETAQVTATASGGSWAGYLYSIDNVVFGAANVFSGLGAGDVTIYVRDSENNNASNTITITEPAPITLDITGPYTCVTGNGSFTVTVSNGTGPYTVSVTGPSGYSSSPSGVGPDFTFSSLADGEYTIKVTDNNSCESEEQQYTIAYDNDPPVCTSLPDDYFMPIENYNSWLPVRGNLSFETTTRSSQAANPDTLIYTVDTRNFDRLEFNLTVAQVNNGWQSTDFLAIHVDYNMDGDGEQYFIDRSS
jgi:hypothetical protein